MVEGDQQQGRLSFPDFLWLLRDVDTLPTSVDGSQLFPTQFVKKMLKTSKLSGGSFILQYFPSFHCLTIPPPSTDPAVLSEITSCLDKLSPQFNKGVDAAIEHILNTVRVKEGYDSSMKCDGRMLACLLEQHFTVINRKESGIPNLQVSWQMAVELRIRKIADSLVDEYIQDMSAKIRGRLPMRSGLNGETGETLINIHLQVFDKRRLEFQDAISPYQSQSSVMECDYFEREVAEIDAQTGEVIGGRLFKFIQDNMESSEKYCTTLYKAKYDKIVQVKLQNALSEQIPTSIDEELHDFFKEYHGEALGPAKESVYERLRAESAELESELKRIPGPVTNMRFVGISDDRVKIRWECPTVNPQAAEQYMVRIRSKGKDWETSSIQKGLSALVTGLDTNTKYCLSVLAFNQKYIGKEYSYFQFKTQLSNAKKVSLVIAGSMAAVYLTGPLGAIGAAIMAYQLDKKWAKKAGDITSDNLEEIDMHQGEAAGGIVENNRYLEAPSDSETDFESSHYIEVDNTQLQDLIDSECEDN